MDTESTADYFLQMAGLLKAAGVGRPRMVIDRDHLDHNIDLIKAGLGPQRFRLVTKSLPSGELIRYVLQRSDSNRIMAFHTPFVHWLLTEFPDVDILFGKPMLIEAVAELFSKLSMDQRFHACESVQWLVDTQRSLVAHGEFARTLRVNLRINVEIDVGLGRGGIDDPDELKAVLKLLSTYDGNLTFSGLMGYDAHIPYMPEGADQAFNATMDRYAEFRKIAQESGLAEDGALTFNSGGSQTWQLYQRDGMHPVDDIATGSALLKPSRFNNLGNHQPGLFIAAPVIKQFQRPVPSRKQPSMDVCNYLYGGGWAAKIVWPPGVEISSRADPANENLLPNQSLYYSNSDTAIDIGDFVFFQPHQSDAIFQFEDILVVADGRIVDTWRPIPLRF